MELTDNAVDMKAKCVASGLLKFENNERCVYEPEAMVRIHNAQAMWNHFFSWSSGNLFGFMIVTNMHVHVFNDKYQIKLPICNIAVVATEEGLVVPSLKITMENGGSHKFTFGTMSLCGYRQTIRNITEKAKNVIVEIKSNPNILSTVSCESVHVTTERNDVDNTEIENAEVSTPQRICTKCGASIVLGNPTGQMSCISIIAAVVFVVTLLLMIWACIHDISEGIGLSKIPFFWFLFILFISGAVALAGYCASQTVNDSDCPECNGENTLIDINSPMGQKLLAETKIGQTTDEMDNTMCLPVEGCEMEAKSEQAESNNSAARFCTRCGMLRKQGERFCGKCGHKL